MENLMRRFLDWLDRLAATCQAEDAAEGGTREDYDAWERLRDEIDAEKRKL